MNIEYQEHISKTTNKTYYSWVDEEGKPRTCWKKPEKKTSEDASNLFASPPPKTRGQRAAVNAKDCYMKVKSLSSLPHIPYYIFVICDVYISERF